MRRLARALPILLLLTACSAKGPAAPPPAPAAVPAATAEPAAVAPRPAIDPAPYRVEPSVRVKTLRPTRLWTGPGTYYLLIRELPAGATVQYLSNRQGWLRIRTADGENGYVTMADAELADGRGQDVTYSVANARWQIKTGFGLSVDLARAGTGVMRITLAGLPGAAEAVSAGESAVLVRAALPAGLKVAGDIGDSGVGRVSVSEAGILIDLEGEPLYKVTENGGGRLVLEVRPALMSAEQGPQGWKLTYRGSITPALRQDGGELVLDLPGAMPGPGLGAVPGLQEVGPEAAAQGGQGVQGQSQGVQGQSQGVQGQSQGVQGQSQGGQGQTQSGAGGNTLPVSRLTAGGLRLRLPVPKGPYALYRPCPGCLELRYLPAGLAGKTIVLDPGHGGEETGAAGPGGYIEKNINLAVALRLKPLLEQAGARVLMTRTTDTRVLPPERWGEATSAVERTQLDLAARSALSNGAGADLFVSIHANGGPAGDGGTEVYWANSNLNAMLSQRLADLGQQELLRALGLADRGFKQRPFNVIRMSDAPGMLVEMGFMTDPWEEQLLASDRGQQAAAGAIAAAISRYFQ